MALPKNNIQVDLNDITKDIYGNYTHDIAPTLTSFTEMVQDHRDGRESVEQTAKSANRLERARALYLATLDGIEKVQSSHLREMAYCFDGSERTLERSISIGDSTSSTNATTIEESSVISPLVRDPGTESANAMMVVDMQAFVLSILNRTCVSSVPEGEILQIHGPKLQHKRSEMLHRFGRRIKEKVERTARGIGREG